MNKKILLLFSICILSFFALPANEVTSSDANYSIEYQSPNLKYLSKILPEIINTNTEALEIICELKFRKKFTIHLHQEVTSLPKTEHWKANHFYRLDNEENIHVILDSNHLRSHENTKITLLKKLCFVLFRQNKLPENIWYEEALFEWIAYQKSHLGCISLPDLNIAHSFQRALFISNKLPQWQGIKDLSATITEQEIVENMASIKLIVTNHFKSDTKGDLMKMKFHLTPIIAGLKKYKPWQEMMSAQQTENYFKNVNPYRILYLKSLENFNYPVFHQDKHQISLYPLKYSLRLLSENNPALAEELFQTLLLYPPKNVIFPELGLYFSKNKKKTKLGALDTDFWMEYFLLNQIPKSSQEITEPQNIKKLIEKTINAPIPDFNLSDEELDLYRTIQYLLFIGESKLALKVIDQKIYLSSNLKLRNLQWALGFLCDEKKIIKDFLQNQNLLKQEIWPELLELGKNAK